MFIDSIGHYVPSDFISNDYFQNINGLSDEWIYTRTGIKTRRKASEKETANSMGVAAVKNCLENFKGDLDKVDLIIGASYTPYDTVGTLAHVIQREFSIKNAKAVFVSSACSSLINAI